MPRRLLPAVLILLAGGAVARAQVPAGAEIVVNTATGIEGVWPTVEMDDRGRFIVGWSNYDGIQTPDHGTFIRRYDADGTPLAAASRVDTEANGITAFMSLAGDGAGNFVVSWHQPYGPGHTIRRFDAAGRPRGAALPVSADSDNHAGLAMAANGSFTVVWQDRVGPAGSLIRGRRYDANGAAVGDDFQVNASTTGEFGPSIAGAPDGRFVVVWRNYDADLYGVRARLYDASARPVGGEFQVNTSTPYYQWLARAALEHTAAMAPDGSFTVTWTSDGNYHSHGRVFAQRYDSAGNPQGGEQPLDAGTARDASESRVATDVNGNYVVVWAQQPAFRVYDIVGRRFDRSGAPRGDEFRIATATTYFNEAPVVDSDPSGNFVVTWGAYTEGYVSVRARRFGGLLPAALTVDAAGNGVLEPGESVVAAPSWRNVNGAAQTFSGTLTSFSGPGGHYTITDGAASYGTLANASTGSCGADCYGLSVSGPRPALHWDGTAEERLAPDSQGQVQHWSVHIGDSFADVPRGSGFYRFVETLLHRGVTGGCGASLYCPAAPTTRDQLAVFALLAREGPLYAPPACGTPLFADVPAGSPYCRWIEELARRGVTGGCGGGNYCPADAVSREQMAVFMLRTLDPALDPPACTTPLFADVPATSPFCKWIEELARRHVVTGCAPGAYCPTLPVSREQMSVFLGATFGLTLYGI